MPNCPNCDSIDSKVYQTKHIKDNRVIKRYRDCLDCGTRFITEEKYAYMLLTEKRQVRKYELCRT